MKNIIIISLFLFFVVSNFCYALPFTYYTSDFLRLRKDENLKSEIITVLEPNLGIEIIEKGKNETIDDITADWVKVKCANGYIGWCFSGYLNPIENDVANILSKEVAKIKAGAYPKQNNSSNQLKNITSLNEITEKDGYYIQQQSRRFQGHGRAPEILQLSVLNNKVFVREIDIVKNKIITLKETEFSYNGTTYVHDKSQLKLDEKNRLNIFYLENIPEKKWLGTYEYDKPYTKVPEINYKLLVDQTSDVFKNYAGEYIYDSFKIIKNENMNINLESIKKADIKITYNQTKKCLSADCHALLDINSPDNRVGNFTLDFIETSASEPFYWTYGEGTGYSEEKFWFYKGGIAISYEYSGVDLDDDLNVIAKKFIKYVVFLKKIN